MGVSAQASSIPTIEYSAGHADIGVEYDTGKLELHYGVAPGATLDPPQTLTAPETEFDPDELFTRAPDSTVLGRPAGSSWDFVGNVAGEDVWILPASEQSGVPFLGFAAEEVGLASEWNGPITFTVDSMVAPAGGEFSIWQIDTFGSVVPLAASFDGFDSSDAVIAPIGSHAHFNLGFTAEGVYEIDITASGERVGTGVVADTATFFFAVGDSTVIPEPASLALLGLAGGLMLIRLRSSSMR